MNNLILSLTSVLGSRVYSTRGVPVATLSDVLCNKDTGRITHFILSTDEGPGEPALESGFYAVHHSYFYFASGENVLTFSSKLGNEDQGYFLELPERYDHEEVGTLADFNTYLYHNANVAGHRSDND